MRAAAMARDAGCWKSMTLISVQSTVLMIDRPPGLPVTKTNSAILLHDRRRLRTQHPFAAGDGIGGGSNSALRVRFTRKPIEVSHLVVQHEARAANDNARAPGGFQRVSVGDRHPFGVHD